MSGREREDAEWWRRQPTSAAALSGTTGARQDWTDGWHEGAGVRLHTVSMGTGPLVLLLHGFPDFWYLWRRQLPLLAAAGFRAVACDLRGYNLSERPRRVEEYRLDLLADDVAALVRSLGETRAHVVAHDWGGAIAWHVAVRHPDVIDRLVICNAPHPARFRQLLRTLPQAARSWYVRAVQVPWLPERALGASGGWLLDRLWRGAHHGAGALTAGDLAAYHAAFRTRDARWAALAYYRALARFGATIPADGRRIPHRTLVLWGERDPALVRANADGLQGWVPSLTVRFVPEAGHWVMSDAPEVVNAALLAFLAAP